MSNRRNKKHPSQHPAKEERKSPSSGIGKENIRPIPHLYLLGILGITALVFFPSLHNGFVNWDDQGYVYENDLITSLTPFSKFFTTPVGANFHPLTMITLAANYAHGGLDPFGYHCTNYILHLGNTILVFFFILILTRHHLFIASVVAVLFGIHPMHVESVAWISERKDVLYTFFFLASLIAYSRHALEENKIWFFAAYGGAVLSMLAKPAAVVLPAVMLLIDHFLGRPIQKKIYWEKIPLFIISIMVGIITLKFQRSMGALHEEVVVELGRKILFACYGFITYLGKLIIPINLSPFYPYPAINEPLPVIYYISPLMVLLIAGISVYSLKYTKAIAFGILFFFLNVVLVLQLISVGSAIVADRYTYVSSIGLFFVFACGINYVKNLAGGSHSSLLNKGASLGLVVYLTVLSIAAYRQCGIWKNGNTLWTQAIQITPSAKAYANRAKYHKDIGGVEQALSDYDSAIALNPTDADVYNDRGNLYLTLQKYSLAMSDYEQAFKMGGAESKYLKNRGTVAGKMGRNHDAIDDLTNAIKMETNDMASAYNNRAWNYFVIGQLAKAAEDYAEAVRLQPDDAQLRVSKAIVHFQLLDYETALRDCNHALRIQPEFKVAHNLQEQILQAANKNTHAEKITPLAK